jgi:hypothetical protein
VPTTTSASASFTVTSYWAMHFHALRELAVPGANAAFAESLAFGERWSASGGKSGARFERSRDGRLVVKHVSRTEFDMFVGAIAPRYFEHVRACAIAGTPSFLARVLGAYKVVTLAPASGGLTSGGGGGGLAGGGLAGSGGGSAGGGAAADGLGGGAGAGLALPLGSVGLGAGVPTAGGTSGTGAPISAASAASAAASSAAAAAVASLRRVTTYVIVMEDLFHGVGVIPAGLKFDLKGKLRAQKRPAAAAAAAAPGAGAAAPPPPLGSTAATDAPLGSEAGGGEAAADDHGGDAVAEDAGADALPAPLRAGGGSNAGPGAASDGAPAPPPASAPGSGDSLVLYDGDFMAFTGGHPLPLTEAGKRLLDDTVRRDTEFLRAARVVDYSLLIGLDPVTHRLTVGVIDYQPSIVAFGQIKQFRQWCQIAIHAEHRVSENQLALGGTLRQPPGEGRHIAMWIADMFSTGQLRGINQ